MTDIAFEITLWEESSHPQDDALYAAAAEGPQLARIRMRKRYSGELEADSVGELQTCGQEGYLATERVTGALAGRAGTFVLQHGASSDAAGQPRQFGYVVPDSGTGELAGLRGEALIAHGQLSLDWELPHRGGADTD